MADPISNPNPHNLTFPYPLIGTVVRPPGQGCSTCVHQTYCPAVYWFRRYGLTQQPIDDVRLGRACASWSNNPADQIRTVAQADLDEEKYMYDQGIGSEANRSGITTPTTGGDR
jgi:hypothetical protein